MKDLERCSINNLNLSKKSQEAVGQIRDVMEQGNHLAYWVGVVPVMDLFFGKQLPQNTLINIAAYDWEQFTKVMISTNLIVKGAVLKIAEPMVWETSGKEGEFWRCVSDAAL